MLVAELSVLQTQMLDGLSFDPFTLLDDAYGPAEVGVCTDLRLGPSSRPLRYRLPPPSSGRTRRQHPQLSHNALDLVEEDRHLVALLPFRRSLACSTEIPVLISAPHPLMAAVVTAIFTACYARVSTRLLCAARYRCAPSRGAVLDAFQGHTS